jgi:hypothetical protein
MDKQVRLTRSAVGVAHRRGDPEAIKSATRELAAAKLADFIARTVDAAPPLTPEQRDRLALLLRRPS